MSQCAIVRQIRIALLCLSLLIFQITRAVAADDALDFDLNAAFTDNEQELPYFFGGYFESRTQIGLAKAEAFSLRQRLHAEFSVEKDILFFFANGNVDYDPAVTAWTDQRWERERAELRKIYLAADTEYVDVTAGQQIIHWGTGDGINPMDLFNPIDSRDPIANARSLTRKPIPLIQGIIQTPLCTLEGVFIPRAVVNTPALSGSPWEPLTLKSLRKSAANGIILLDDENNPTGSEYGLRTATTMNGWDISLLYFAGYAKYPVYARTTYSGKIRYEAYHPRLNAYGIAFAKGLSKGTIRGELAYKPKTVLQAESTYTQHSGLIKADLLQGVVGIDWTFLTDFYVTSQYFMDTYLGDTSNATCRSYTDGITFLVSNKYWDSALEAGIQGMIYLSGDGLSVEIYAQYDINDHWKLTTGFLLWDGKEQTILGQYLENDMVYLKLKYAF